MDDGSACRGWDNTRCEGTPYCPPRCPRFVDKFGTPLLFFDPADAGVGAEAILDLYDCGPEGHSMSYPPYRSRDALADWIEGLLDRGRNFVALDDGRPVGHAVFAPETGEEPEFAVFVDPSYRGRGVAGELLRHCIVHAGVEGHRALVMNVQANHRTMLALAESHGFVVEDDDPEEAYAFRHLRLPLAGSRAVDRFGLVPERAGPV